MYKSGLLLSKILEFPQSIQKKLLELNISTAEEFISITNTEDLKLKMISFLKIDKKNLDNLINLVKGNLPNKVVKEMEEPDNQEEYHFGALEPEE